MPVQKTSTSEALQIGLIASAVGNSNLPKEFQDLLSELLRDKVQEIKAEKQRVIDNARHRVKLGERETILTEQLRAGCNHRKNNGRDPKINTVGNWVDISDPARPNLTKQLVIICKGCQKQWHNPAVPEWGQIPATMDIMPPDENCIGG